MYYFRQPTALNTLLSPFLQGDVLIDLVGQIVSVKSNINTKQVVLSKAALIFR